MKNIKVGIYINSKVQHPAVIENMILKCKKKVFRLFASTNLQYKVYKDKGVKCSGFKKLLDDIDNSVIEVIVTTGIDRLVTNAEEIFYFINKLYTKKIRLICADDSNLDIASETFRLYQYPFLRMLAELEYRNRSNEVYGSKKEDYKNGRKDSGNICKTRPERKE